MKISQLRFPFILLAAALALGLAGDLLLYDKPMGISFPLLMAAALVVLVGMAIAEKSKITWVNVLLAAPLLYLAWMSSVRAAPFLRFVNIAGALMLLALLADRLRMPTFTKLNLLGYTASLLQASIAGGLFAPVLLRQGVTDIQSRDESGKTARRILLGVLIALPFLCIFTVLFASADMLFSNYLEDILGEITLRDLIGHSFLTAVLAWVAMGGLAYALGRAEAAPAIAEPSGDAPPKSGFQLKGMLGTVESSIALFSIDALFLVFVAIQFAALFGGEAFLESQGLTYSEYARRGFFELLTVALITLALILSLDFVTRRESGREHLSFLSGCGLMIALTIIILVSAFQRLRLYELAYGFTRLRVHSHVLMVWLAVLLACFLVLLLIRKTRLFATGLMLVAIGFSATLNTLNPDLFIVQHNLQRYEDGEELDVAYLGGLSADAIPALMPLLSRYGPEIRDETGPWLHMHLDELDIRHRRAGWPSAHSSIDRAYRLLDREREDIESYEPAYRYMWD